MPGFHMGAGSRRRSPARALQLRSDVTCLSDLKMGAELAYILPSDRCERRIGQCGTWNV
jgi:hypothetical protein